MAMESEATAPDPFDASVQLIAASYGTISYVGDYQGVIPSLMYQHDRFSVGAAMGLYRINLNGLEANGIGDVMLHAAMTLVHAGDFTGGVVAMVSAPTGDDRVGLGMGHPMAMPSIYGVWARDRLTVSASAGYSRALAEVPQGHDHGVWPLVEPMNMSEVTWGVGADLALTHSIHGGARVGGGHPFDLMGHERVVGALRLGWVASRVDTGVEVQTGFVGDPYTVRGLVETALHF
ncbi:MAG TPA: hypothetical protein VGC41_08320 [Kofleriaceae bacterium]